MIQPLDEYHYCIDEKLIIAKQRDLIHKQSANLPQHIVINEQQSSSEKDYLFGLTAKNTFKKHAIKTEEPINDDDNSPFFDSIIDPLFTDDPSSLYLLSSSVSQVDETSDPLFVVPTRLTSEDQSLIFSAQNSNMSQLGYQISVSTIKTTHLNPQTALHVKRQYPNIIPASFQPLEIQYRRKGYIGMGLETKLKSGDTDLKREQQEKEDTIRAFQYHQIHRAVPISEEELIREFNLPGDLHIQQEEEDELEMGDHHSSDDDAAGDYTGQYEDRDDEEDVAFQEEGNEMTMDF